MHASNSRRLVFQPQSYRSMQAGANQIVNAIRPTLGPLPRITAIDRIMDERMPELLDNGGLVAKRIIQVPDRHANVGAMFVRDFLWQLHEQEGDGAATAAVLFQSVFDEGVRQVTAGHNARRLQVHIEEGMRLILSELGRMTRPVTGKEGLARVANTVCHDAELSELLGEMYDIVGEYGRLEIRKSNGRALQREYVEGMYWDRGLISREMISDHQRVRTDMEDASILITDLDIREAQDLLPVLACALQNDKRRLLIIANTISDAAMSLLLANNRKPEEFRVIAVKTPGFGAEEQSWFLNDIAILCGGRPFVKAAGDTLRGVTPEHFGRARRVWAAYESFGIIGGRGDPRRLRTHIASLRTVLDESLGVVQHEKLRKRLGKLLGGSATLRIGGVTESDIEERREVAERTASAVRSALREGVVPGGGVALLRCQSALQRRLQEAESSEEIAAFRSLIAAVSRPLCTIAENAGYDPGDVLAQVRLAESGHGFDAVAGAIVDMEQAGIVDPVNVVKAAVYAGISSAALALTIDVIVHRADQPTRATPRTPGQRKQL